ncbi:MAG TPA: CehA/McbA family metallohydrolase [Thermoguttaceae bacterium]|nr:CehA/McbA family metallohydrolase [Thermoguttaceae bacterium]
MVFALVAVLLYPIAAAAGEAQATVLVRGEVVDAQSGAPLAARVYVRTSDGQWLFARSASPEGTAVEYRKERSPESVEMHTTVSAHPFLVDAPPGRLTIRVERGKEYSPVERTVDVGREPPPLLKFELARWIDMAALGWYSGDTHVHRSLEELPNLLVAEDLNVGLPLSYWVTTADTPPGSGPKSTAKDVACEPIYIDPTHVIYPVNTEYEIFTVAGKRHTLGAVFALGHKTPFEAGVPPVGPIAEEARRQGALLDLDKHSWPWSLMLVPVMQVDLFELANNHVWRTEFAFRKWTIEMAPEYQGLQIDEQGFTEWGWIDFGFQTYYALLNCGFRMRPTAGTASGVHPVPLGFGRVYVHLPGGFSYEKWMEGLGAGRSFVTTGPMLMVEVEGQPPGATIRQEDAAKRTYRITGQAVSSEPLRPIEIVAGGEVVRRIPAANRKTARGAYESPIEAGVELDGSSWIAVRAFEDRPDKRIRFAHSSPVHVDVPGKPLRPRREEVDYLIRRMKEEIERNGDVLRPEGLQEYREALRAYEDLAATAR